MIIVAWKCIYGQSTETYYGSTEFQANRINIAPRRRIRDRSEYEGCNSLIDDIRTRMT